ncbi:hypothetical protein GIB67_006336 [Kingdonia uniflora]|uniref:Hexosyltransferase n=1 Tax=Kingdonia uniflora TaxID=39325 RepID=A0A7J7P0V8_9MAGN|nr:hypothetical protein GIB67_006336 [Kingdonia uniflora]
MQTRGSNNRLPGLVFRSRISSLMLTMFATMAVIYVAGRLWQDAENRVYLMKELDRITGQGKSAISVDDTLKVIACREQQKKLLSLEMELSAARQEGFVSKHLSETNTNTTGSRKNLFAVIGIATGFGRKNNRDAIRKAWMPTGRIPSLFVSAALKKLEKEKGIILRFVIGRSANRGDSLDQGIDNENRMTNDFFFLENHVEAPEELPKKTKLFIGYAADTWDAEFYAKVNDDVYVNIGRKQKWFEPDWWKFGDGKSYFRHASGEMFAISRALAQFVSINTLILRTYAHDDVSVGSWFIGLDVKHIDEAKFCCSSWSSGAICAAV